MTTPEKTTTLELTEREMCLLIASVDTRIEHLLNWGWEQGLWKSEAEKRAVLNPLEELGRSLLHA